MLVVFLISLLISLILLVVSIIKGWVFLPIIWIGCSVTIIFLGWFAVAILKPRFPEWWERNIAGVDHNSIEL